MLIKVKKSWELPESAATPEHVFFSRSRRRFLAGAAGAAASIAAPALAQAPAAGAQAPASDDPSASRYPAQRNLRYRLDPQGSEEPTSTTCHTLYTFSSSQTN